MYFADARKLFLDYCTNQKHLSGNTVLAYCQDLTEFARHIGKRRVASIRGTHIVTYSHNLLLQRQLSPATVKRRMASLRLLFAWLKRSRVVKTSPFNSIDLVIRLPQRLPRCLDTTEIARLMRYRKQAGDECALGIALLMATGMRVGELVSLRLDQVHLDEGRLRVFGKGSRERTVFVTDGSLLRELSAYVARPRSGAQDGTTLLINRSGLKISTGYVRRRIAAVARLAGIQRRVTPHMLRHTSAKMLLEAGADIRFIQRLLGHQSIATTEIYAHVTDQALRSALARANILAPFVA